MRNKIARHYALPFVVSGVATIVLSFTAFIVLRTVPLSILIAEYDIPMGILTVSLLLGWIAVFIFGIRLAIYWRKYKHEANNPQGKH